jgi:hypothetical protein
MQSVTTNTGEHSEQEEREIWNSISQNSFQKAYSDDEPDYSDVRVLEPNPNDKLSI